MSTQMNQNIEYCIKNWLKEPYDEKTRAAVKELIKSHPEEIPEAFGSEIAFGTGGMRAKMGVGPGRMNVYTVQRMIQGLVNYVKTFPQREWQRGIAICHDSRLHSREFAETAARVIAAGGIQAHLVPELRPTPFASFACRYLKCIAALNFTASHNPKEYNGCKIYWKDGGQAVPPHDLGIIKEIDKINDLSSYPLAPLTHSLITLIPRQVDQAYLKEIQSLRLFPFIDNEIGSELQIHYSPLHGAGITMIPQALKLWGLTNIHLVKEQSKPDGNFPTAAYPNPEHKEALALGYRDLQKEKGDILLVSDPDSDRLSCSILHEGKPLSFTGNELGTLMLHYLIDQKKPTGRWATITTIVSTPLIRAITEKHGGTCFEVLTGFKYIAEKIHQWEAKKSSGYHFLFGMEESLGYLYGTYTRDKDATIAACLTAEMALHLKRYGKTLLDYLYEIYDTYGIYRSGQRTLSYPEGPEKITQVMTRLRSHLPHKLTGIKVLSVEDYLTSTATDLRFKKQRKLDLPKSNVLLFRLDDGSVIVLRPSGTEPYLKLYGGLSGHDFASIPLGITTLDKRLASMLEEIEMELLR